MDFKGVLTPSSEKPQSQYLARRTGGSLGSVIYRDQFDFQSIMLMGAVLQLVWALVFCDRIIIAAAPALLFAGHKLLSLLARIRLYNAGKFAPEAIKNPVMAVVPREDGEGRADVTAIILTATSHHPLGIFAPGFKDVGTRFNHYGEVLDEQRDEYGYLGGTSWVGVGSTTGNSIMAIHYFRSAEGLSKFALKGAHAEGMSWWAKTDYPHIGISHELITAPANNWEALYLNEKPLGLGATSFQLPNGSWRSPLVDISKKHLSSEKRRFVEADFIKEEY